MLAAAYSTYSKHSLIALAAGALAWSFWFSPGWLTLCAGLALFLFGMQQLEQGLKSLAGGRLQTLLAASTATPGKGLLFGCVATFLLQSSTLVSLLTIAFLSTGLITLAGSLAVLFGANLGATSGIWLLAMAGQNLSMAPLAMPLLVFGVLLGFSGARGAAIGRLLLGIGLIFLGIDEIKQGFTSFGDMDLQRYSADGLQGALLFVAVGALITVVVQSSHATLMLTLAALGSGQLELQQSLCIAIGSNVGSSVSTAVMGMIGSSRSGQRLAIAHVVFNCSTAVVSFALLSPLSWLVVQATGWFGAGSNLLIQLALFHTLFNVLGVLLFWPWQPQLAAALTRWLPDKAEPAVLIATQTEQAAEATQARYLQTSALQTTESAARAVAQELQHMGRLSLEVICHALYCPLAMLEDPPRDDAQLRARVELQRVDADRLYQLHIKGVYAQLLAFMGKVDLPVDPAQQQFWHDSQVAAFQMVDAVKNAHRLQRNMHRYLPEPTESAARRSYIELRHHVLLALRDVRALGRSDAPDTEWAAQLQALDDRNQNFADQFRQHLFAGIRSGALPGLVASSLMNDLGFAQRMLASLRQVLLLGEGHAVARQMEVLMGEAPLIEGL
ncbi:Na/Pi symporter [Comamonas terrigena]|uniref:Na/Pi cotransporter family protein n=1 Tax=Comamonas terrigena TaxID=32013 RepID=UPI002447E491|nr:Na/Pi symporter [Comamonas terrigena]MDH1289661.1 Na/Pi symporter [Comamonas terrigena]